MQSSAKEAVPAAAEKNSISSVGHCDGSQTVVNDSNYCKFFFTYTDLLLLSVSCQLVVIVSLSGTLLLSTLIKNAATEAHKEKPTNARIVAQFN